MYATINRVRVFMLYLRDPKNLMCQLASCPFQLGYQLPTHPAERSLKLSYKTAFEHFTISKIINTIRYNY